MTLLTIISNVAGRLSLTIPTSVVGSTDAQVIQLYTLTNKAGHDLSQAANWQALIQEKTFVTVNATVQPSAVPTDFDHFIANSFYNRTTRRPIVGPITSIQWQNLIAQPSFSTVYLMYRQRAGQFLLGPPTVPPPAGQTIAYEYVSTNWAKSATNVAQSSFLADTDTSYLDESLITDAVVWMFLRAKGLSYAEEMQTYGRNLDQQMARDGGSSQLALSPRALNMTRVNLPDGNFGP